MIQINLINIGNVPPNQMLWNNDSPILKENGLGGPHIFETNLQRFFFKFLIS